MRKLKEHDSGTIVHMYSNGYVLMEFVDKKGKTIGMEEVYIPSQGKAIRIETNTITSTKQEVWV